MATTKTMCAPSSSRPSSASAVRTRRSRSTDRCMPRLLPQAAVDQYRREGFYSPVRVMSAADARRYRDALEGHEAMTRKPLQGNWRHKMHLLVTWADELVHHPKILDRSGEHTSELQTH